MKPGAFSVRSAVKDISKSGLFYEQLGFTVFGGNQAQNWLISNNDQTIIGLIQGMFKNNIFTFNPDWDGDASNIPEFSDVRIIQRGLKKHGLPFIRQADENTSDSASFIIAESDENQILADQHG